MDYLTRVWDSLEPSLKAELHAGEHKQYRGLHQLRIEILAAEAERRPLGDSFSDVLNKTKRWMD
jgi:hypothetical protein